MSKPNLNYAKGFLILFLLFSLTNLLALTTATPLDNYLTKPFLLIWLGLYAYLQKPFSSTASGKWLLVGLFFSFLGDTLLLFADDSPGGGNFFLLGLGSFLLTHIAYWMAFHNWPAPKAGLLSSNPWLVLPFVIYWVVMIFLLWPGLPAAMLVPVLVYSMVIVLMAIKAWHISPNLPNQNRKMLLTGVLLFVLSDSIIALSKFSDWLPYSELAIGFAIMLTYLIGQLLIVLGMTKDSGVPI